MTFIFLLPFIASFSSKAAPEAVSIPKAEARFTIERNRNEFAAPIQSQEIHKVHVFWVYLLNQSFPA